MPQTSSNLNAQSKFESTSVLSQNALFSDASEEDITLQSGVQLKSVMSELNRLSETFAHSYQTLESQVEKLNGQLQNEAEEKQTALEEKQQLLIEKASLTDRLQSLLAIMPAGVVVIDGNGRVKDCNAVAVDILGRPLLGQQWVGVISRAFEPRADDGHQVSLKDGRKIHIETRALDSEPGQLVLLTDLTKTRQLQAELSQQQKLSSMGKMIASLAHQIRTPLSAAILYGSHLRNNSIGGAIKQQFSDNLMERLHFIERQVNDMLNFMKGERKQKSGLPLNEFIALLSQMANELPRIVEFNVSSEHCEDKILYADKDALTGAIMNLLENACDACEAVEAARISITFIAKHQLIVVVKDNGMGISDEHQKKVFEPFFTSKPKGNGLGLAIVHGVILDHGGTIKVKSQINTGTRFEITLPLENDSAKHSSPHTHKHSDPQQEKQNEL